MMAPRHDTGTEPFPTWLLAWQDQGLSPADALARFDDLPAPDPENLIGHWRGRTLPTGHTLDSLLEALGWHGKRIETPERVHPLLFRLRSGRVVPLEPAVMPAGLALRWPALARSAPTRATFAVLAPLLRARGPGAHLAPREFQGRRGTAIVYHRQPIADHLRQVGPDHVIGLMERTGMAQPFFFLLSRELPPPDRPPDRQGSPP